MEFKFLHILAFLSVAIVASHASLPSEEYWNSVLPNNPMPKAIKDLLQPGRGTNVGVGKGGVIVGTRPHSFPLDYGLNYNYAATKTQLKDNPNFALFLEKDLHTGKRINLQFSKTTNQATFLSQQLADSIPFSSIKLPEIFDKFSVSPSSDQAKVMKKTVKECEEKAIKGEEKLCATSLESMVDFTTSKLGKDVRAISTITKNGARKEYRIVGVKRGRVRIGGGVPQPGVRIRSILLPQNGHHRCLRGGDGRSWRFQGGGSGGVPQGYIGVEP